MIFPQFTRFFDYNITYNQNPKAMSTNDLHALHSLFLRYMLLLSST
nr:MAG TPA: hypothetical protein [Caudoviricetes sp.]